MLLVLCSVDGACMMNLFVLKVTEIFIGSELEAKYFDMMIDSNIFTKLKIFFRT
jgi:hypothetical protein